MEGSRPSLGSRLGLQAVRLGCRDKIKLFAQLLAGSRHQHGGSASGTKGSKWLISLVEIFLLPERTKPLKPSCSGGGSCMGSCVPWGTGHPGPFPISSSAGTLLVGRLSSCPGSPRCGGHSQRPKKGAAMGCQGLGPPPVRCGPLLLVAAGGWALNPQSAGAPRSRWRWQNVSRVVAGDPAAPATCCHQSLALRVRWRCWLQRRALLFRATQER